MKTFPDLASVEGEALRVKGILDIQTARNTHLERGVLRGVARDSRKTSNPVFATLYLAATLKYTRSVEQRALIYDAFVFRITGCCRDIHLPLMQYFLKHEHDEIICAACRATLYSWSLKKPEIAGADWCWVWNEDIEDIARQSISILNEWGLTQHFKMRPNQFDRRRKKLKQERRKNRNRTRRGWGRAA